MFVLPNRVGPGDASKEEVVICGYHLIANHLIWANEATIAPPHSRNRKGDHTYIVHECTASASRKAVDTKGQQQEKEFRRIETRPTLLLLLVTHVGANTCGLRGSPSTRNRHPQTPSPHPLPPNKTTSRYLQLFSAQILAGRYLLIKKGRRGGVWRGVKWKKEAFELEL